MTLLDSRYKAVLRTYVQRPAFRALAIVTTVDLSVLLAMWWLESYSHLFDPPLPVFLSVTVDIVLTLAIFSPYVLFVVFGAMLMAHVREQLNNSRAGVVPAFRIPHLVVVFAAMVSVPVVITVIVVAVVRISEGAEHYIAAPLGILAILLGAMSLIAWFASIRSPWLSLFVLPLFLLLLTWDKFPRLLESMAGWREPGVDPRALLLLMIDFAMLARLFRRLARPHSEGAPMLRRFRPAPDRVKAALLVPDRPHHTLATSMARAWHRRHGVLSPLAPWLVGATLGAVLVCITFILGNDVADLQRSILLPTVVPGVVISLIWRERWQNLGYESLYPAPRREFVQELLCATAISLGELWLATALAVLPPILIHHPRFLAAPMFSVTLIASAAMQFMVFGIMFLTALFPPLLPYVNAITILAMLMPISFAWADVPRLSQHGLLTVAGIEMLIGMAITLFGYATWCRTDLA